MELILDNFRLVFGVVALLVYEKSAHGVESTESPVCSRIETIRRFEKRIHPSSQEAFTFSDPTPNLMMGNKL